MGTNDWQRVERLFHAAQSLPVAERPVYLVRECAGDMALRAEVESLLEAYEAHSGFMKEPALGLGLRVLSGAAHATLVGRSVGAYRLIEALGHGGMGDVYLAEDTRLGRKVALKFIAGRFVNDNWAKRQLVKEAQAVAMLDHPNICPVHSIEEEDGHSFIVMQYIEGDTLADLIRERPPMPAQSLAVAVQIVSAIAEAHAHGIIHRDIKPRNVVINAAGQAKVLDFGLAKVVQRQQEFKGYADDTSQLSRDGLVPGTIAYMSPEQLRAERLDFRSDVFSLGTLLYELFTGRNPFERPSGAEVVAAILTDSPEPPVGVPPELGRIILKCLEKDKAHRYESASALLYDLSGLQRGGGKARGHFFGGRLAAACALLILLAAVSVIIYSRQHRSYTLAVLPVNNESADAVVEYLDDGLADGLINRLSGLPGLRVKALTTVSGYRGRGVDSRQVGQALGVDAVLTGTLVRQGDALVLQTSLVEVADGAQLWGSRYEVNPAKLSDLEEGISRSVAESLKLRLGAGESQRLAERDTVSDDAFREYKLGSYYLRYRNEENIKKAIEHFNAAIELDPIYAKAHAGLADCYVLLNTVAYGQMPTEEAMSRARAAAKEAIANNDDLPEAHTSLGVVSLRYDWDWQSAEKEFRRAIELKPDYAPAHYWYSNLLIITGRREEAVAEGEAAKKIDPFSPPTVANFCRMLSLSRQDERAIACYGKLMEERPDYEGAQYLRALVQLRRGQDEEALATFQRMYAKKKVLAGAALAYAYGKAGRVDDALKVLAEMETLAKEHYVPPQEFAVIFAGLGDKDRAFFWLEQEYQERFATLPYITVDPIFSGLRSDPRYAALVERLKLPAQPSS
jgi:serine/threonine-protein kinase